MARDPFDPPYTKEDLPELDVRHHNIGLGRMWFNSDERAKIAGTKMWSEEINFPDKMEFTTTHIFALSERTVDDIAELTGTSKNLLEFKMGEAAAKGRYVMIYVQEVRVEDAPSSSDS